MANTIGPAGPYPPQTDIPVPNPVPIPVPIPTPGK